MCLGYFSLQAFCSSVRDVCIKVDTRTSALRYLSGSMAQRKQFWGKSFLYYGGRHKAQSHDMTRLRAASFIPIKYSNLMQTSHWCFFHCRAKVLKVYFKIVARLQVKALICNYFHNLQGILSTWSKRTQLFQESTICCWRQPTDNTLPVCTTCRSPCAPATILQSQTVASAALLVLRQVLQ